MPRREKKQFIRDLKEYDVVDDIFVVKEKKGVTAYSNGYRFTLILGDKTGEIEYKYWGSRNKEEVDSIYNRINEDDVVYITGKVSRWQDKLEISANKNDIITVLLRNEYFLKDFIASSKYNVSDLLKQLDEIIDSISNEQLNKLLKKVFGDNLIRANFSKMPCTIYHHYNWVSGVLEHSINVAKICDFICKIHTSLDRELLVSSALLHDIGKIYCYKITTSIKQTKECLLLGHVAFGMNLVNDFAQQVGLDKSLKEKLLHIILSHHSDIDKKSMNKPSTPEAVALNLANKLDSMVELLVGNREEIKDETITFQELGKFYLK